MLRDDALDYHVVSYQLIEGGLDERVLALPCQGAVAISHPLEHVVDDHVHLSSVLDLERRLAYAFDVGEWPLDDDFQELDGVQIHLDDLIRQAFVDQFEHSDKQLVSIIVLGQLRFIKGLQVVVHSLKGPLSDRPVLGEGRFGCGLSE